MHRGVGRHSALKFNQVLLASLQPTVSSPQGWRGLPGFSRSFAFQPMDSFSVAALTGNNARVLGFLPTQNGGGGSVRVHNSSVPRVSPAVTRRSFRESRKLVTRRSRHHSTSSRIRSTRDFSPHRLLECAVDVLRNFNEKVNKLFQPGGDNEARDFTTAVEEKVLTSADSNGVRENRATELVGDDAFSVQQRPGNEFEWRFAIWEAEIASVEESETVSQRPEADVENWADEKIEDTVPAAIFASPPELPSPENGNVTTTVSVGDSVYSVEAEDVEVSPVEEPKLDPQSGHISELSGFALPESAGVGDVEVRNDDKIEEALAGPVTLNGELENLENGNIFSAVRESDGMSVAIDEPEVSSSVLPESALSEADVGLDEKIAEALAEELEHLEVLSSVGPASTLSEADVELDEKIEEALAEELELPENGNTVSEEFVEQDTGDGKFASGGQIQTEEDVEASPVEESKLDPQSGHISEPQPVSSFWSVDLAVEGLSLAKDVHKQAFLGSTEGGEAFSGEGHVATEESGLFIEKRADTENVSEDEIGTLAVDSGVTEVKPVSHDKDLSSEEFGESFVEQDRGDGKFASGGQIQAAEDVEASPMEESKLDPQSGHISEPQPVSSFWSVDLAVEGLSLEKDVHKQSSLGSTEGGEAFSGEGHVATEESGPYIEKRADTENVSEDEIGTLAVDSGVTEVNPVSHDKALSSEEFGESFVEQDRGDGKFASGGQIQAAEDVEASPMEESKLDPQSGHASEPQPVGSFRTGFRSVDLAVGESSDGLSLDKDVHTQASLGSTEDGETFPGEGQVATEESGPCIEKRGDKDNVSEDEIAILAVDSGVMEVKPVSPAKDLSSEEFGESSVEQDGGDRKIASAGQIQTDLSTGSDSSTAQSFGRMDDLPPEISRLRKSISHHAYLYHTLDSPVISDAAYDSLVKKLVNRETQVSNSESTLNLAVAAQPSPDMLKVVHSVPMLSLASVQKEEEVFLWYQKLQQKLGSEQETLGWVVEPKVDGLALSLRYENGNLTQAATRGNGLQGEDVTHNARSVLGIPLTIPDKLPGTENPLAVLEVRGEIFMSLKDFKEWNASKIQSGEKPMANPRNAAAGSMRLLSSNASDVRPLEFMAYSIAVIEGGGTEPTEEDLGWSSVVPKSQWEVLQSLQSAGFTVNDDNRLFESFDSALEYARSWRSTRKSLKYEADGLVLKVNDLQAQASLGSTGANPRWALAWKFAATEAVSVLEGIELTIGRSGAIIPNARFKVLTDDLLAVHSRHVKALGLCEGDHIVVQRAGDVIPQVVHVLEDLRPERAQPWSPPQECPACGSTLTEISASSMVFCSNSTCPSRHSRQVAHFAKTLISGLGSANLGRLEEELVKNPADFYDLDENDLSKVKGFGKQSAKKLLKAIEESKQQNLWLFIAALGVPKVGANTAKELAKKFGSLQALLESDLSGFTDVPGIGAATARCIFDWCQSEVNIELVCRLEVAGCKINGNAVIETQEKLESKEDDATNKQEDESGAVEEDIEQVSQTYMSAGEPDVAEDSEEVGETPYSSETSDDLKESDEPVVDGPSRTTSPALFGMSIVITGDFGPMKREDMNRLVTQHSGVVRKSVTSKTSFVLCGNRPGPLKLAEASRRGIKFLDWQNFLVLIGQRESDIL